MNDNKEYIRALSALSTIYLSIHEFDLRDNSMTVFKSNLNIDTFASEVEGAQEKLFNVMRKTASEQHRDMILKFVDLSTLNERLAEKGRTTCVFVGKYNGWCRARFIVSERDEEGRVARVLYCVENINKEKEHENHLLRLANTDSLTGLNNRGNGEKLIGEMMEQGRPGMFCVLDVDKFKHVNDFYGHGVGDMVLVAVAEALRNTTRDKDLLMRYGGDEFIAFLPDVQDAVIAQRIMNRLFSEIGAIEVDGLNECIAISVGAQMTTPDMDYEEAFRLADENLYRSKNTKGSSYVVR